MGDGNPDRRSAEAGNQPAHRPPGSQAGAAMSKEELEKEKLRAEIAELEQKTRLAGEGHRRERRKQLSVLGVAVVTITSGLIGAGITASTFLDQRQRAYDLTLTKEIIQLSESLAHESETRRTTAALLLSAYEQDAVPLLLMRLESARSEAEVEAIVRSLQQITTKEKVDPLADVVMPLRAGLASSLAQVLVPADGAGSRALDDVPAATAVLHHLTALVALAPGIDRSARRTRAGRPSAPLSAFFDSLLVQLDAEMQRQEDRKLTPADLFRLKGEIETARDIILR